MKVCLISAAASNIVSLDSLPAEPPEEPPLGLLCVAAALERNGVTPELVDLDWLFAERVKAGDPRCERREFSARVAKELSAKPADCFGFSSICSSYPLTLRIVTLLKRRRPDAQIVLGGPQATVAASETLEAFPTVDVVVRGEPEQILPKLAEALSGAGSLAGLSGITFRRASEIVCNPEASVLADLDSLPLPAFHLYPHLQHCRSLSLEFRRGCPFQCTFCSTGDFLRRRYRPKSPECIIGQMKELHRRYRISRFGLIHDNFAVDRKRVVKFCEALLASGCRFHWACSARTDRVDDSLLDLMRKAGCDGIFFGIETGSARMQKIIRKSLDLEAARQRIRHANRRRMASAVALIAGFPEETLEDLRQTVDLFVETLRFDYVDPQNLAARSPWRQCHLPGAQARTRFRRRGLGHGVSGF